MQHYELCFIVSGDRYTDETYPEAVSRIKKLVTDAGVSVTKEEDMGKRKLAYPINHIRFGYYVAQEFDAETSVINALNDKLRLHDDVVRHLIVVKKVTTEKDKENERKALAKLAELQRPEKPVTEDRPRTIADERPDPKPETTPAEPVQVDTKSLEKKLDAILNDGDTII